MDSNDLIQFRIRTPRRRKRMQKEALEKTLLRFHREEKAIWKEIRNLGWTELSPPVQQGFVRFFVLRGDVKRTKEAVFFEKLLTKINTTQWSYRKDFKKKQRKHGKKIYAVREQTLNDVREGDFRSNKFTDQERAYFYETMIHVRQVKKPVKVFRFVESWRFVLRVQPNMITKVRIKDQDLERRNAFISRYFTFDDRRNKLRKLLHGWDRWRWHSIKRYEDPFHNRSFADILEEHYPEPVFRISHRNPRNPRGFSFVDRVLARRYALLSKRPLVLINYEKIN